MIYTDHRVYKNEDKANIFLVTKSVQDVHMNITILNTPNESSKSNKKVLFKSINNISKKIKALVTMVLGTIATSYDAITGISILK